MAEISRNSSGTEPLFGVKVSEFAQCCHLLELELGMTGPEVQASVKVLTMESMLSALEHIQKLQEARFTSIVPYIAYPTIFLSHTWGYTLRDIIESLVGHEDEFVWFDLLSVPQNGGTAKPFSWWRDTFFENVRSIGKVVMVIKPFDKPVTLSRAWCVFELFACISTQSQFDVAMPAAVKEAFLRSIREDHRVFFNAISGVRTAECQAGDPADKERIGQVIEDAGGYGKIDQMVVSKLKDWFVSTLKQQIAVTEDEVERAGYTTTLGAMYKEDAKYAESEQCLVEAVRVRGRLLGAEHRDTLWSQSWLGEVYAFSGQTEAAERTFAECLAKQREALGESDEHTLRTMNNLGVVRGFYLRKFKAGAQMLEECLAKARTALGPDHELTMAVQYCLALVALEAGELEQAELGYEECLGRRKGVLGAGHPETLGTMQSLALVREKRGRVGEALEMYEECLARQQEVMGLAHHDTLTTMSNLALLYEKLGQGDRGRGMYEECVGKMTAVLGEAHPDTLSTTFLLGSLLCDLGRFAEAEALLTDCVAKMKSIHHKDRFRAERYLRTAARGLAAPAAAGAPQSAAEEGSSGSRWRRG